MKRRTSGPFLDRFFFFFPAKFQIMFQECRMSNIRVFGMPVDEKISYLTIGSIPLIWVMWIPIL